MIRIFRVFTLVQGSTSVCRHHFYKVLICIIFLLLAAQYSLNVFFYKTSNYFSFNVSSWSSIYSSNNVVSKLNVPQDTYSLSELFPTQWPSNQSSNFSLNGDKVQTLNHYNANTTLLGSTYSPLHNTTIYKNFVNSSSSLKTSQKLPIQMITSPAPSNLSLCPHIPPKLVGPVKVWTNAPSFEELEKLYPDLELGGRFRPSECISRHKVAIIIPYRDREEHLRIFLHNIHPILQRQQLDYGIYIIEQKAKTKFNRAKLMNVGYAESLKQYDYQCFVFHDVDLLPEDDRNIYSCPEQPRHMSVAIDTFRYKLPYDRLFGGVSALNKSHMEKINGFSNQFWGWGGEDDDMANRIIHFGYHISRYPANIARYKMLKHKKDEPNPERYKMLYKGKQRYKTDGIHSLHYQRLDILLKRLYTWVYVDLLEKK